MKRILSIGYILVVSLLCSVSMHAQPTIEEGNALYAEGEYAEAVVVYQSILDEAAGALSKDYAVVYYNLGNAYFKQGEVAQSILAYERALRLRPTYADAKYNLAFAQSRITDNIQDTQAFFISNWAKYLRNLMAEEVWMWLSISLFILCLVGLLLFLLNRVVWVRKMAFHTAWVSLLLTILCGINAGSLHHRDTAREEAIVIQGIVNVKSSPDRSGTELFTIHEGTKVQIREVLGKWCNVQVGNNQGWMEESHLEKI